MARQWMTLGGSGLTESWDRFLLNLSTNRANALNFGEWKMEAIGQEMIGKAVIIRTTSAGVHFGTLFQRQGQEAVLTEARRIWHWKGAFTLSKIAESGVGVGSKISVSVPSILLTGVIEVIPCSDTARVCLATFAAHQE